MRLPRWNISVLIMFMLSAVAFSAEVDATASEATIDQQRQWFAEARQALDADKTEQFAHLKSRLVHYPLFPYLELWQAQKALEQHRDDQVAMALEKHAGIPEAVDLRLSWIKSLAERGQWPHVAGQLAHLPGVEENMPDIAMVTLWRTGRKPEALEQFGMRWQQGMTTSDIAVPLERAWLALGHPLPQESRARIVVMAGKGRWGQVKALAEALGENERQWLQQWRSMQADPVAGLEQWVKSKDRKSWNSAIARAMLDDVMHRMARQDVRTAWKSLHQYRRVFDAGDLGTLKKRIALKAASLQPRARLYLLGQDHRRILRAIRAMPEEQQAEHRWIFWKAQALEALGQKTNARRLYEKLSGDRGYYSFLSAEHLKQPYQFSSNSFDATDVIRDQLAGEPAMLRAYEWWMLGEAGKANREWYLAMQGADAEAWKAAAELAVSWGWYDRGIYAAYRAGEIDALAYRFPKGYASTVHQLSNQTGLTPSLIWSVIRQESAFNQRAVSRTGARGLMQLMPGTASHVARKNDLSIQPDDLFDASMNIRIGTLYLVSLEERFEGNMALMAAAYNAGPTRVSRWLERTPFEHSAAWIEAIPFSETRRYVQQVLAFTIVYDWLQQKKPAALLSRFAKASPRG